MRSEVNKSKAALEGSLEIGGTATVHENVSGQRYYLAGQVGSYSSAGWRATPCLLPEPQQDTPWHDCSEA